MSDYRGGRGSRNSVRGGFYRPGMPAVQRSAFGGRGNKPVWFLVIMDVLLLGIALNIFALSDNLLRPEPTIRKLPVKTPAATAIQTPAPTLSPTAAASQGGTASAETTPTATPTADQGMWGAKFPDKFTGGDIQKTDTAYRSHDVSIEIGKHETNGVVYFVADIYVRNLQNFQAAFAKDSFTKTGNVDQQAADKSAILAINGDNIGNRENRLGYAVRNGTEYHTVPYEDVLVMYQDGSMKSFTNENFNYDNEIQSGVWQVWSFGPMLLDDSGQPMTSFNSEVPGPNNSRTAVGYYEPGHYCFIVVDGRQEGYSYPGMSLKDLSQLFYQMGCKAAYNLDGGQTSVMVYDGKLVNHPYNGGRVVSDILYVCETK